MEIGSSASLSFFSSPPASTRVSGATRTPIAVAPREPQLAPAPLSSKTPEDKPSRVAPDEVSRELTIDASTREIVFRAISTQSGEVVRQVPDQALLRIKAYAREMRQAGSTLSSERVA